MVTEFLTKRSPVPAASIILAQIPDGEFQTMVKQVKTRNSEAALPELTDDHIMFLLRYKVKKLKTFEMQRARAASKLQSAM